MFLGKFPQLAALQRQFPKTQSASTDHKAPTAADKARSEANLAMRDEVMQRQDAYDKHAAQVGVLYTRLKTDREKLKGAGPAMTAFNARAAEYQNSLSSLATEKTQLDAPQQKLAENAPPAPGHPAPATAGSIPSAAVSAEAPLTRADMDNGVSRIRTIVNRVPPVVTKPPHEASWSEGFHPGATKPDFDHSDIASGREIYDKAYILMTGAPNVFYRGPDCEFNSQTKFFYLSRTVPKKRFKRRGNPRVDPYLPHCWTVRTRTQHPVVKRRIRPQRISAIGIKWAAQSMPVALRRGANGGCCRSTGRFYSRFQND